MTSAGDRGARLPRASHRSVLDGLGELSGLWLLDGLGDLLDGLGVDRDRRGGLLLSHQRRNSGQHALERLRLALGHEPVLVDLDRRDLCRGAGGDDRVIGLWIIHSERQLQYPPDLLNRNLIRSLQRDADSRTPVSSSPLQTVSVAFAVKACKLRPLRTHLVGGSPVDAAATPAVSASAGSGTAMGSNRSSLIAQRS